MTRWLAMAACAALGACAATPAAQDASSRAPIPPGGMRVTRVTDPTTVCTVVTASTLRGVQLGRPRTTVVQTQITVTWRRVEVEGTPADVVCLLDGAAHQVVSVKVNGVERLNGPQPY